MGGLALWKTVNRPHMRIGVGLKNEFGEPGRLGPRTQRRAQTPLEHRIDQLG
jgi:hypothetical protein